MQANAEELFGGEIADHFWRVEFQRRGSPHVHMILWIRYCSTPLSLMKRIILLWGLLTCAVRRRGAPDLTTEEGQAAAPAYIDSILSTSIPPESDDVEEQELREQVLSVNPRAYLLNLLLSSSTMRDVVVLHVSFDAIHYL